LRSEPASGLEVAPWFLAPPQVKQDTTAIEVSYGRVGRQPGCPVCLLESGLQVIALRERNGQIEVGVDGLWLQNYDVSQQGGGCPHLPQVLLDFGISR
jgi:hypothetical protein